MEILYETERIVEYHAWYMPYPEISFTRIWSDVSYRTNSVEFEVNA